MQRDIYKTAVSVFPTIANRADKHHTRTIGQFLQGGEHYAETIAQARHTIAQALQYWRDGNMAAYDAAMDNYRRIKQSLPVAIMQGVCPDAHDNGFTSFSDVVCLDIDAAKPKDKPNGNEWIEKMPGGWETAKGIISGFPFVAYCGLSVGGRGLFVLVPVADGRNHQAHWRALVEDFAAINMTIDPSTKNPARKRIISLDRNAYENHDAQVYEATREEPKPVQVQPTQPPAQYRYTNTTRTAGADDWERAQICANIIARNGIDITAQYDDWLQAAAALAHEFGERGRSLFHMVAAQSPKYRFEENEMLYTNLQHPANGAQCSINSFFYLCKSSGVQLPKQAVRERTARPRAQRLIPTPRPPKPGTRPGMVSMTEPPHHVQTITPTHDVVPAYVPEPLTPAEEMELTRMADHIAEGVAMVDAKREQNPVFADFCDLFGVDYFGHDDWHMTAAQFENFFAERHNTEPPF